MPITPGTGDNVATFQVTRDALVQMIQAMALVDPTSAQGAGVDATGGLTVSQIDLDTAIRKLLNLLENPPSLEPSTGRLRITLDAMAGGLTLANVSTCATVTTVSNLNAVGGEDIKQTLIFANELQAWGLTVRNCIVN